MRSAGGHFRASRRPRRSLLPLPDPGSGIARREARMLPGTTPVVPGGGVFSSPWTKSCGPVPPLGASPLTPPVPQAPSSLWQNPRGPVLPVGARRAMHPAQTAGDETHAAQFGGGSAGDPSRLNRVASRRSSLRFGRNTLGPVLPVGAPPSRALSVGRLPGLGAHVGSTTAPLRGALRCASVEIHPGQFSRWGLLPRAPCQPGPHREDWPHRENWASPVSALTRVSPQAASRRTRCAPSGPHRPGGDRA